MKITCSPSTTVLSVLCSLAAVATVSAQSGTASFHPIGFLPGQNTSEIRAVTADGSVAVGTSGGGPDREIEYGTDPIKWTLSGGLVTLPRIPADGTSGGPPFAVASDISASGSWIAYRAFPGWPTSRGLREAVICSGDLTQKIVLGRLAPSHPSVANQISDNGSVAFGFADDANFFGHSFRWTAATGMQQLAEPAGFNASNPAGRGVSADGSVSVGEIYNFTSGAEKAHQAYRWTSATGMQSLGALPGGSRSAALAVSADGATVFGVSDSSNAPGASGYPYFWSGELFLWTAAGGMTPLGAPVGYDTFGNFAGITADAELVCIVAEDSTGALPHSFFVINTTTRQAFDAYDLLVTAGAGRAVSGWSRFGPFGISDNGDTLFGRAYNPGGFSEGWVAQFPTGYLRNVRAFVASDPNASATLDSGSVIARDGSYSANDLTVGCSGCAARPSAKSPSRKIPTTAAEPPPPASLTLSGSATLDVGGPINVDSNGTFNLLDTATATANGLNIAGTLGVGLTPASASIARLTVNGPVTLSGAPILDLIVAAPIVGPASFTIIDNRSGQPIQGTFSNVPVNTTFTFGGTRLLAKYNGGDGNDLVVSVPPPVKLTRFASRKSHKGQDFDAVFLPASTVATECRSGGSTKSYTLVFTFENALTTVEGVSVTAGTVGSTSGAISSTDARDYIVTLTGVENKQYVTVALANLTDSLGNSSAVVSQTMGVLLADVDGTGLVDGNDVSAVQSKTRQRPTTMNFRADVNTTGLIDGNDVSTTQTNTRNSLP